MKYLSELTPAEILILIDDDVTHQELLKITFIDLLFKNVLKTKDVTRKLPRRNEYRTYIYIEMGSKYDTYNSLNHERIFLSSFGKDYPIKILFKNLVKISYQKSKQLSLLKYDILKTPNLKNAFSRNFFQKLFYKYSFTEYGNELRGKINKEIRELNREFSSLNNIENQKALNLIKVIGGSIFLLDNIDYSLLNQIDMSLANEINYKESGDSSSGCSSNFDDFSSNFDSGCSSDSGGGGDSGCGSGCSGCGGCGGCGG